MQDLYDPLGSLLSSDIFAQTGTVETALTTLPDALEVTTPGQLSPVDGSSFSSNPIPRKRSISPAAIDHQQKIARLAREIDDISHKTRLMLAKFSSMSGAV